MTALWHPQANMAQVDGHEHVMARGEGAYLWDEDGREYFDAPASLWYCNIGHGRADMAEAVRVQLSTLEAYSAFGALATRPALRLAERLSELVPLTEAKIFFTSGGSDAIDTAAKLARRYWSAVGRPDKRVILTRELAYHGLHGFGTSITGLAANREGLGELMGGTHRVATNDTASLAAYLAEHAGRTAAFFCEPVMGTGGVIPPAPGYLEEARRLCREHDVLFVSDEVITGFGRLGTMFGSDLYGLEPDMLVFAKGITSGYMPLGGVAVDERVWAPFFEAGTDLVFRHGLTYSAHAGACAAGTKSLDILDAEGLVDRVAELSPLLHRLALDVAGHPLVAEVRTGVGLLAGVQAVSAEVAATVARHCEERGVLMRVITNGTLQLSPPFVSSEDDLKRLGTTLAEALDEAAA